MNNDCNWAKDLWADLDKAETAEELLAAVRKWGSNYGMHSDMPKHLWDKLEAAHAIKCGEQTV